MVLVKTSLPATETRTLKGHRMKILATLGITLSIALLSTSKIRSESPEGGVQIDSKLASYEKQNTEVSGDIKAIGSDTMINMMLLWTGGFKRYYPDVKPEIEGKGSSTAPPALI